MNITNTLIKRIDDIKNAGVYYNNFNKLEDKILEIKVFIPSFNVIYTKFNSIEKDFISLKNVCIDTDIDFNSIAYLFKNLKKKINEDEYDKVIVNTIKKDLDMIQKQMQDRWDEYVSLKISSMESVMIYLGNLISDFPEKSRIQEKKRIIYSSGIAGIAAVKAIEDYILLYNDLMNKLKLKDNIISFLTLLSSGNKVTFDDINEEIYIWIKDCNFSKKININII